MVDDDRMLLLGRGRGLVAGIVDPDGRPYALRAWGVTPSPSDEGVVRVILGDDCHAVGDWIVGTRAAVTGGDVATMQSLQIKGRVVALREPDDDDLAAFEEHSEAFYVAVHESDGDPIELLRRLA